VWHVWREGDYVWDGESLLVQDAPRGEPRAEEPLGVVNGHRFFARKSSPARCSECNAQWGEHGKPCQGSPQPAPLVRTEVEILRERVAAMEAQIAALTPPEPDPVPNPMTRAVSRWPGSVGFMQGLRWLP
jgi:hypothetical protein